MPPARTSGTPPCPLWSPTKLKEARCHGKQGVVSQGPACLGSTTGVALASYSAVLCLSFSMCKMRHPLPYTVGEKIRQINPCGVL